jgi:hypothetical protein
MGGNDTDFVLKNVILWLFTVFIVLKELFKVVFFISWIYGSSNCIWRIYFVMLFNYKNAYHIFAKSSANGKQSTVNKSLDGSMYPG